MKKYSRNWLPKLYKKIRINHKQKWGNKTRADAPVKNFRKNDWTFKNRSFLIHEKHEILLPKHSHKIVFCTQI